MEMSSSLDLLLSCHLEQSVISRVRAPFLCHVKSSSFLRRFPSNIRMRCLFWWALQHLKRNICHPLTEVHIPPGCWYSQNRSEIQSSHCSACSFFLSCRYFTPAPSFCRMYKFSPVFPTPSLTTWLQEVGQGPEALTSPNIHTRSLSLTLPSLLRSCALSSASLS